VRALLANSYVPTPDLPARVVARSGAWHTDLFPNVVFPADSYLEMLPLTEATWTAAVRDAAGVLLASAEAGDVVVHAAEAGTLFEVKFRETLRKYELYRGSVRLRVNGTGIQAVNLVSMNDYLRGVVPSEMPALWHVEAVRSQAVASRGYAYAKLKTSGFFDVRSDSADQVYGGAQAEHSRSNAAVWDTSDVVVTANGAPVQTFFFATAGGHTENNEYAFVTSAGVANSGPLSHLRGRPDVDANGLHYDRNAPNYAWASGSFTWAELSTMLAADARTDVGTLTRVDFERGVSGRAYRVTLTGSAGSKVVSGGVFKSVYNARRLSGGELKSTAMYLEPSTN
jgi:stage II sporulation protein D